MKITMLFIALLVPFIFLNAQTEGMVKYTETIKLKMQLPEGPEGDEMRKMVPPTQSYDQVLFFNDKASIYREPDGKEASEDKEFKTEQDGMDMKIVLKHPENRIYRDLEKGGMVESREFFGRFFLVQGDAVKQAWKITPEQKKILDYNCQKAILQDTARTVEAWFTPQIPVSIGPANFGDLPGLILELDVNHGERTTTATKVDRKPIPKDAIVKPTKGKSVTRDEFKKIVDEKTKEMNAEGGGNGMRVIIRN
jgi:GLPGLI family protein